MFKSSISILSLFLPKMLFGGSLVQSILGVAIATPSYQNLTSLFGPHLSPRAQIILPTDDTFASQLTQRWTDYNKPSYIGAIKPATESDIQKIVSALLMPSMTTINKHRSRSLLRTNSLSSRPEEVMESPITPASTVSRLTSATSARLSWTPRTTY